MPAQLEVFLDASDEAIDALELGEILIPEAGVSDGEPVQLTVRNTGDTNLRNITVSLRGDGADQVQLAADGDDGPGVWAAVGQSIVGMDGTLYQGEEIVFWARGVYHASDAEGREPFEIVFNATSTG